MSPDSPGPHFSLSSACREILVAEFEKPWKEVLLGGKKKKEAQRDTRMSSQAKGGDKPSKLPLISRALMICQALCKVFTCMISINHCNSPALKKNEKPKQHFFTDEETGTQRR